MTEMFPPQLVDLVRCVEREIRKRESVYPRLVWAKKMSQAQADKELWLMKGVLDYLRGDRPLDKT